MPLELIWAIKRPAWFGGQIKRVMICGAFYVQGGRAPALQNAGNR